MEAPGVFLTGLAATAEGPGRPGASPRGAGQLLRPPRRRADPSRARSEARATAARVTAEQATPGARTVAGRPAVAELAGGR